MTNKETLSELMHRATVSMLKKPFQLLPGDPGSNAKDKDTNYIVANSEFDIDQQVIRDSFSKAAKEFGTQKDYDKLMFHLQISLDLCESISTLKRIEQYMTAKEFPELYERLGSAQKSLDSMQQEFNNYLNGIKE